LFSEACSFGTHTRVLTFLGGKCAERNETSGAGNAEKRAYGGGEKSERVVGGSRNASQLRGV